MPGPARMTKLRGGPLSISAADRERDLLALPTGRKVRLYRVGEWRRVPTCMLWGDPCLVGLTTLLGTADESQVMSDRG